jgi:hypothetical protein
VATFIALETFWVIFFRWAVFVEMIGQIRVEAVSLLLLVLLAFVTSVHFGQN